MLKIAFKYVGFRYRQHRRKTNEKLVVDTVYGPVRGVKRISCWDDPYYSFERIPFAKPPVGELRFAEPQPADAWNETLDCTDEGGKPMQPFFKTSWVSGVENCLFVNVYTRDVRPAKPKPVMVWIHGGGFINGSAGKDFQSPDYILHKDVVYVALAYRLGIFGFLSMKDPSLKVPGNAGLKDLVLGLKWVKANISRFGGDPNNITIFGLSAGGAAVHYLGLTEQTRGLFHRMIAMSGAAFCPWAAAPPKDWAYRVAKALGYKGGDGDADILKFLRSANCKKITAAEVKSVTKDESHNGFLFTAYPVVEPYVTEQCVLPQEPYILARTAWTNDIPMLTGFTSREGMMFPQIVPPGMAESWKVDPIKPLPFDLKTNPTSERCQELGKRLSEKSFPNGNFSPDNIIDCMSYCHFVHPVHRTIRSRQKFAKAPTYLYLFDYDSPEYSFMKYLIKGDFSGVSHGVDLGYMFANPLNVAMPRDSRAGEIREAYVGVLTKFATDGDPVCPELGSVKWEPVQSDDRVHKCLRIAEKIRVEDNPFTDILTFWDELYEEGKLI